MIDIVCWWRWVVVDFDYSFSVGGGFKDRVWWFLVNNFLGIVGAWPWFIVCQQVLIFASCLCWTELSSVSSLNLINQLILHGVPWLISAWPWNNLGFLFIHQTRESLVFFRRLYCLGLEFLDLNLLIILSRSNICWLLGFFGKPLCGYSEWSFLPMRIKFLRCNWVWGMNFIGPGTGSRVFNVLDRIIVWIAVSHIGWWRRFFR